MRLIKFILLFVCCTAFGQTKELWQFGNQGNERANDIAVRQNMQVITGSFSGNLQLFNQSLNGAGLNDAFLIARTNALVNFSLRAGGTSLDDGRNVAIDNQGNIFWAMHVSGNGTIGSQNYTANFGQQDILIAKISASGNILWQKVLGSNNTDFVNDLAVDSLGNCIVTGSFSGQFSCGALTVNSILQSNGAPSTDAFITKIDANGNELWLKRAGGKLNDQATALTIDQLNDIYFAGNYSDTLYLDNIHPSTSTDAGFIFKLNASGAEQWFRRLSALQVTVSDLMFSSGNLFVSGDFSGNISLFSGSQNLHNQSATYSNRIFIFRIQPNGSFSSATSFSSASFLSASKMALHEGNLFLGGKFSCSFSQACDIYGNGVFNSIGFRDNFLISVNFQLSSLRWIRHFGGVQDDELNGIASAGINGIYLCGSFIQSMILPGLPNVAGNFSQVSNQISPAVYCGDNHYNTFFNLTSSGGSDMFITNLIDSTRQPLDFFKRTGSNCMRDQPKPCISLINSDHLCSGDSISLCSGTLLYAATQTSLIGPNNVSNQTSAGPDFQYSWNQQPYGLNRSHQAFGSGLLTLNIRSVDQCYIRSDSVIINLFPNPPAPVLTDNKGININALNPTQIQICAPDSVLLFTNVSLGNNQYVFISTPSSGIVYNDSIWAKQSGFYIFNVIDSTTRCVNTVLVDVQVLQPVSQLDLRMKLAFYNYATDSINVCSGQNIVIFLFDTIANPQALNTIVLSGTTTATINPLMPLQVSGPSNIILLPSTSGYYTITAINTVNNICGIIADTITRTFYFNVLPSPNVSYSVTYDPVLCQGDSNLVQITPQSLNTYFYIYGVGTFPTNPTQFYVNQPGAYTILGTDTNSFGCFNSQFQLVNISGPNIQQIQSTSVDGKKCANDSILLTSTIPGYYDWYGPNGLIQNIHGQTLYAIAPGFYYNVRYDADSCKPVSLPFEVRNFVQPRIESSPNIIICEGDTALLSVFSETGILFQWLPPLSGINTDAFVTQEGVYYCSINFCGITFLDSIEISYSNSNTALFPGPLLKGCEGDTFQIDGPSGMFNYQWNNGSSNPQIVATQSGKYWVDFIDAFGCALRSDTVDVQLVNKQRPQPIAPLDFCFGDSAFVSFSGSNPLIYLFTDTILPTAVLGNQALIFPFTSNTSFYFQTLGSDGCKSHYGKFDVLINPASLKPNIAVSDSFLCSNAVVNFSTSLSGNYNFNWKVNNVAFSSSNPLSLPMANYSNVSVSLTVKDLKCQSPQADTSFQVYIAPEKPPIVQYCPLVCEGENLKLELSNLSQGNSWILIQNADTFQIEPPRPTIQIQQQSSVLHFMQFDGKCLSDTVSIPVTKGNCDELFPNIITPNNDGLNEEFKPIFPGLKLLKTTIYNRWGALIFETDLPEFFFDGTVYGQKLTDGTYFYEVKAGLCNEGVKDFKGFLQIIR